MSSNKISEPNVSETKVNASQSHTSGSSLDTQMHHKGSDASDSVIENIDSAPCLKHAAQNISRKASDIPSEKINLCSNCSKSMLSYIFVVQDFLDSLAREICGDASSTRCLQCAREELRSSLTSREDVASSSNAYVNESPVFESEVVKSQFTSEPTSSGVKGDDVKVSKKATEDRSKTRRTSRSKGSRESRKHEEANKALQQTASNDQKYVNEQSQKLDFIYSLPPASDSSKKISEEMFPDEKRDSIEYPGSTNQQYVERQFVDQQPSRDTFNSQNIVADSEKYVPHQEVSSDHSVPSDQHSAGPRALPVSSDQPPSSSQSPSPTTTFVTPMVRQQPDFTNPPSIPPSEGSEGDRVDDRFSSAQPPPSVYSEVTDGIISTLSNVEQEVYDTARDRAGWEGLTEAQERLGSSPDSQLTAEAFVTSCRNNAEALGCLAVGTSLLLTRTSRTLCVLVSDGVSTAFRGPLSSVFQVVQYIRSLDSLGTTKLALLEQPELGITFDKLNVWRLVQFSKCVYLNPDTLVIQNCDELFCHDELSAVPDIGWPDCFNSGVFVFVPSVNTFWQLLEFAEKQGSYDGGDQGLLNSYFNSWSSDISKKLSFIYNLMANVSYTYTPAFRQFGRNVKIVQFHGSFKPWHVKFFSNTGQIAPSSAVHPTYVQFVHIWLNIFRISVLRLMSQEIQSYALKENIICAVEVLRFFPLPSESEAEFYLTPPSVRLRLAEKKLQRSTSLPFTEIQRRKSAEFPRSTRSSEEIGFHEEQQHTEIKETTGQPEERPSSSDDPQPSTADVAAEGSGAPEKDTSEKEEAPVDENTLPGSKIGDYQGMKAWEQGRMDYQGSDSSENIIKRLEFLMSRSK